MYKYRILKQGARMGKIKTTIEIYDEIMKKAKAHKGKTGESVSLLVNRLMREYFGKVQK